MQRYKNIPAVIFLSIFSVFMLHKVLPHVHHQHGDFQSTIEHAEHHHHHDHDHNHQRGQDEEHNKNFLGFLLKIHTHTYHSNTFFNLRNIVKHNFKVEEFPNYPLFESSIFAIGGDRCYVQLITHYSQDLRPNVYLSARSLRGPPFLG